MSRAGSTFTLVAALTLSACGGASTMHVPDVTTAEGVVASPQAEAARSLAPTFVQEANVELAAARKAVAEGDEVTASLRAQRAIAAIQRAYAAARLARAVREETDATDTARKHEAALRALGHERARADADVDTLEKKLHVAREAALPAESGRTDTGRAVARLRAATTLTAEAALLCGAARLIAPQAKALADADAALADAEAAIAGKPRSADRPKEPIDVAAVARVKCLAALSAARTAGRDKAEDPDVLFSELSAEAAQKAPPGPSPTRDERGVVLTLHDAFRGTDLTDTATASLTAAARVARAHPQVLVQVVVHEVDASAASTSGRKVEAALSALERGGVPRAHLRGESAGARIAIVASNDTARRAKNARVDVVFVTR